MKLKANQSRCMKLARRLGVRHVFFEGSGRPDGEYLSPGSDRLPWTPDWHIGTAKADKLADITLRRRMPVILLWRHLVEHDETHTLLHEIGHRISDLVYAGQQYDRPLTARFRRDFRKAELSAHPETHEEFLPETLGSWLGGQKLNSGLLFYAELHIQKLPDAMRDACYAFRAESIALEERAA